MPISTNADALEAAYARLSTHEFVLEVIVARLLASSPEAVSTDFKAQLLDVGKKAYGPVSGDPSTIEQMQRVAALSDQFLTALVGKIAERERNMRELRAGG